MRGNDASGLERYLKAQELDYATALAEIKAGHKRSHWMWYIFPQLQGLGHSETAKFYAIKDKTKHWHMWSTQCWAQELLQYPMPCYN